MIVLLILIPVVAGVLSFFVKNGKAARSLALAGSLLTFLVALLLVITSKGTVTLEKEWLPQIGSNFSLSMDGMAKMLCLLNAVALPLILSSTIREKYSDKGNFFGLLLLTQAGMMGVFLAADVLLFYFFWELALIPIYFLCSQYGGDRKIQATFKFFIYTFLGSLFLLIGIIYLYLKTPDHSFALSSFYHLQLTGTEQNIGFWLFFVAFAIKMPVFPLHTWQPDAYEQAPSAGTMILSAVMVKMGIYATIRYVLPIFPAATLSFNHIIIIFSVIGLLYASFIAIRQDDLKRLIAYSSIAHIGLMCAAVFSLQQVGLQGVLVQMFNHGVNVLGLWIVATAIEQQTGTRKLSEMGGLAMKAPVLAILFMVMTLANVSLPLTNSFIGEFLMFNGLFRYNVWAGAVACISIILVAIYSLWAMQKMFYGEVSSFTQNAVEAPKNTQYALIVITIVIIILGVYPAPLLDLTRDTVQAVLHVK
ncbi:NADH dehydrogenase subunit M [Arachidicoccus rhizosphaerae]|uniref:NADH dehydrogenase subunit M n=1 Tax=Arachidicoccus rhizosphaerae TaxID=551991 RepID=A0A1H3VSM4_9BACT|nr:NADH-quinone oxidoreductase subunit M [Arachidicoccus rhizosphaerae]SDZ77098.1 NADH dehydrogenase subunit M [Arachidicoccus rhizosphaerae]